MTLCKEEGCAGGRSTQQPPVRAPFGLTHTLTFCCCSTRSRALHCLGSAVPRRRNDDAGGIDAARAAGAPSMLMCVAGYNTCTVGCRILHSTSVYGKQCTIHQPYGTCIIHNTGTIVLYMYCTIQGTTLAPVLPGTGTGSVVRVHVSCTDHGLQYGTDGWRLAEIDPPVLI